MFLFARALSLYRACYLHTTTEPFCCPSPLPLPSLFFYLLGLSSVLSWDRGLLTRLHGTLELWVEVLSSNSDTHSHTQADVFCLFGFCFSQLFSLDLFEKCLHDFL